MTDPCRFLPRKLELTGDWSRDVEDLYQEFVVDFRKSCPRYRGRTVIHNRRLRDGKEKGFWHLVTRGELRDYAGTPDYDRAERLPWVRFLIEHPDEPDVICFRYREDDGVVRTYIWADQANFAVVLEPLSRGAWRLITAFYIQSEMRRREMRTKYACRP